MGTIALGVKKEIMNDQSSGNTRFVLRLPGFRIEMSGQKHFVEELYRTINRDFTPLIEAAARGEISNAQTTQPHDDPEASRRSGYAWLYLCTAYFNKVYVMENSRLEASILGRFVDFERIRRVYVDHENSPLLTGMNDADRTLFAEFTEEGRAALRGFKKKSGG